MEERIFEPYVFHSPARQKKGVRVTVVGVITDGVLNFAISRCGEQDQYAFVKRSGREKALARLDKGEIFASIPCEVPSLAKFIAAAKIISEVAIKHSTYKNINLEVKENVTVTKYYTWNVVK
jgi:hypothetical protein